MIFRPISSIVIVCVRRGKDGSQIDTMLNQKDKLTYLHFP